MNINKFNILNLNDVNLIRMPDIHSSRGMIVKYTAMYNNTLLYIKTGLKTRNTYSTIQVYTECLVSDLLHAMGVIHVYYNLCTNSNTLYCYSEDFVGDDSFVTARDYFGQELTYDNVRSVLNEDDRTYLDEMFLVDFLFNNIDRHFRNFGILIGSDTIRLNPIFDNGFALYGDREDYELDLDDKITLEQYDENKNFTNSLYDLVNMLQSNAKLYCNLESLLRIVDCYSGVFSNHRIESIKYLISVRYNYLLQINRIEVI